MKTGNFGLLAILCVFCGQPLAAQSIDISINQSIENDVRENLQPVPNPSIVLEGGKISGKLTYHPLTSIAPPATATGWFTSKSGFVDYSFTDNHSKAGLGTALSNGCDAGFDLTTTTNTEIRPFFTFQDSNTKRPLGHNDTDNVGGTWSLTQQVDHFEPNQSIALPDGSKLKIFLGLDSTYTAASSRTATITSPTGSHADNYDLVPSLRFSVSPDTNQTWSTTAVYDEKLTSASAGGSASTGTFSLQQRYDDVLTASFANPTDSSPSSFFSIHVLTNWVRETNIEPLPGLPPASYHNWAKFGAGFIWQISPAATFTADYTYDAFNPTFEASKIIIKANFPF